MSLCSPSSDKNSCIFILALSWSVILFDCRFSFFTCDHNFFGLLVIDKLGFENMFFFFLIVYLLFFVVFESLDALKSKLLFSIDFEFGRSKFMILSSSVCTTRLFRISCYDSLGLRDVFP